MFNEWFQNFANIKFLIDLDTLRDDPSLIFAWELTRAQVKKPGANESLLTYLSFESTDVADSNTTIAATQIKHCLICRHKGFSFVKI